MTEPYLEHYGIPGMKWGVRKMKARYVSKKPLHPTSKDHSSVRRLRQRAKQSGQKSLSNKELQKVITRMELEHKYNKLNPNTVTKGHNTVKAVLAVGGTLTTAYALSKSQLVQDVVKQSLMAYEKAKEQIKD